MGPGADLRRPALPVPCAVVLLLALGVGLVGPVEADVIHLKNGQRIEVGAARDLGETVEFERYGGVVRIPKGDVERIVRGPPGTEIPPGGPRDADDALARDEVLRFLTEDDGTATVAEWRRRPAFARIDDAARITLRIGGRQVAMNGAEFKAWAWQGLRDEWQTTTKTLVEEVALRADTARIRYVTRTVVVDPETRRRVVMIEQGSLVVQKRDGQLRVVERRANRR